MYFREQNIINNTKFYQLDVLRSGIRNTRDMDLLQPNVANQEFHLENSKFSQS